jgi:hypothetical protein
MNKGSLFVSQYCMNSCVVILLSFVVSLNCYCVSFYLLHFVFNCTA